MENRPGESLPNAVVSMRDRPDAKEASASSRSVGWPPVRLKLASTLAGSQRSSVADVNGDGVSAAEMGGVAGERQEELYLFSARFKNAELEAEYREAIRVDVMDYGQAFGLIVGLASIYFAIVFPTAVNRYFGTPQALLTLIFFTMHKWAPQVHRKYVEPRFFVLFRIFQIVSVTYMALLIYDTLVQNYQDYDRYGRTEGARVFFIVAMSLLAGFPGIGVMPAVFFFGYLLCMYTVSHSQADFDPGTGSIVGNLLLNLFFCVLFINHSYRQNFSSRQNFFLIRRMAEENIRVRLEHEQAPMSTLFRRLFRSDHKRNSSKVHGLGPDADADGSVAPPGDAAWGSGSGKSPWMVPLDSIEWGEFVGRGAFGEVFRCRWRGSDVAVKKISVSGDTENSHLDDILGEVSLLYDLRHPCIVLFMGITAEPDQFLIVTEFMELGSLARLIHDNTRELPHSLVLHMLVQACNGMSFLHSNNPPVFHKDLKTENILVDSKWNAKIADFGLSRAKGDDTADGNMGTLVYMAPEVMKMEPFTEKADVYSFGMIMWEVLVREVPFTSVLGQRPALCLLQLVPEEFVRPAVPLDMDPAYSTLMQSAWEHEIGKRPSFAAISKELQEQEQKLGEPQDSMRFAERATKPAMVRQETALMISSADASTKLWQTHPTRAREAMRMSNAVLRRLTQQHGGVEVSADNGGFFASFRTPLDAIKATLEAQQQLVDASWDSELLEYSGCAETLDPELNHVVLFRGLRIKLALHWGMTTIEANQVTRHTRFAGPLISELSRMVDLAHGGEILASEAIFERIGQDDANWSETCECQCRRVTLEPETYWQLLPTRLANRRKMWPSNDTERVERDQDAFSWAIDFSQVRLGKKVGVGNYGEVFEAELRGRKVAVKRLLKQKLSETAILEFVEEACIMRSLVHPNVAHLVGACLQEPNIGMVFEYLVENMRQYLDRVPGPPPFARMFRDIAAGMHFIHSQKLMHRDMKPTNLLLDERGTVKVADFGLARIRTETITMTRCGTAAYCAPEVLRGLHYTNKIDVFGFAICGWEMLTKKLPFKGDNAISVMRRVVMGERPPMPPSPPKWCANLIAQCWSADPGLRPTFKEIFDLCDARVRAEETGEHPSDTTSAINAVLAATKGSEASALGEGAVGGREQ